MEDLMTSNMNSAVTDLPPLLQSTALKNCVPMQLETKMLRIGLLLTSVQPSDIMLQPYVAQWRLRGSISLDKDSTLSLSMCVRTTSELGTLQLGLTDCARRKALLKGSESVMANGRFSS